MDVQLILEPDPSVEGEERDRFIRQLRSEIRELDVESIQNVFSDDAPEGAKGADPITVGAIVIALTASGGVLNSVIGVVRDLLGRQSTRQKISVTIDGDSIELDSATVQQREKLIRAFTRRHGGV